MSIARGSFSGTSTAVRDFVRIATFSARSAVLPSAVDVGLLPAAVWAGVDGDTEMPAAPATRSEEHTSELQSLMRISYAVFCLKKKTTQNISIPICHIECT